MLRDPSLHTPAPPEMESTRSPPWRRGTRTRAVYTSTFGSAEALEKVLEMGMEEGARSAIDQMDGFLAGSPRPV